MAKKRLPEVTPEIISQQEKDMNKESLKSYITIISLEGKRNAALTQLARDSLTKVLEQEEIEATIIFNNLDWEKIIGK